MEDYKKTEEKVIAEIKKQITENAIFLYIKGTDKMPQCGFSAKVVRAIVACGKPFKFVNVLERPDIRAILPRFADWPTFPQVYVNGELIGGCDIVTEMHETGELRELLASVK